MMKRVIAIGVIVLGLVGCGASEKKSIADQYHGMSAEEIYTRGERSMANQGYKSAIADFEAIEALYPFSINAQQAQLNLIYANFSNNQFAQAEAAANRYIHLYPRSEHVDYAYYMKGLANFNQDRGVFQRYIRTDLSKRDISTIQQSFADFNELISQFPHSAYVYDARERMIYLRNLMAQQQLNIAVHYFSIQAYVAAINRANQILIHYQDAPQVVAALGVIAQSYHQLGLKELAEQTKQILALNFPESEIYKKVVAVLQQPVVPHPPIDILKTLHSEP